MVSAAILNILLVGMLGLTFNIKPVEAITIEVPDDYPTIQEAVCNANAGDNISVKNGTYYEAHVAIEKPLTLAGQNKVDTVIAQLNISCPTDVCLDNICVNSLDARNSSIVWATRCRFKEVYVGSSAKLLLSQSEAWAVHAYSKGEILGFYDLPLFGRVVFSLPFGFIFYILPIVLALAFATILIAVYVLQRRNKQKPADANQQTLNNPS